MTFEHFDRKYRNNDYLFVTGEISIGEYQIRQYELLKRYVDDAFKTYESRDEEREKRYCVKCKYDYANFTGDPEEKKKHCGICVYETKDQFVPFKEGE